MNGRQNSPGLKLTRGTHQPSFSLVRMHVPHPAPAGAVSRSPFMQPSTSDSWLVQAGYGISLNLRCCTMLLQNNQTGTLFTSLPCRIYTGTGHLCFNNPDVSDEPVASLDELEEGLISESEEPDTDQDKDVDVDKTVTEDQSYGRRLRLLGLIWDGTISRIWNVLCLPILIIPGPVTGPN